MCHTCHCDDDDSPCKQSWFYPTATGAANETGRPDATGSETPIGTPIRLGHVPNFTNVHKDPWDTNTPGTGHGPLPGAVDGSPHAGFLSEPFGEYLVRDGAIRLRGNTRAYLAHDSHGSSFQHKKYVKLNLQTAPLTFTADLSQVPCGCLACV